jgi:hypothetical protein
MLRKLFSVSLAMVMLLCCVGSVLAAPNSTNKYLSGSTHHLKETFIQVDSNNEHSVLNSTGECWIFNHEQIPLSAWLNTNQRCMILRWLNFDIYRLNDDGSNGELIFHDRKRTDFFGGPAKTEVKLLPGKYKLVVSYNGNYKYRPASRTVYMYVMT